MVHQKGEYEGSISLNTHMRTELYQNETCYERRLEASNAIIAQAKLLSKSINLPSEPAQN